jgi:general secretion pathway protein K
MSESVRVRESGFALIESIAVLALSAMVLLALLITSSLVVRNSAGATRRANAVENLATGLDALRRDLAGARFTRGGTGDDAPVLFDGRPQALGFVTPEGDGGTGEGASESMIWIAAQGGEAAGVLVRSSAPLLPQMTSFGEAQFANPVVLLAGPWTYRFSYAELGAAAPQWRANWSNLKSLPDAVRLELLDRAGNPAVPPVVIALQIDAEPKCEGRAAQGRTRRARAATGGTDNRRETRRMRPITSSEGYITLAVLVIAGLLAAFVSTLIGLARPAVDLTRLGSDKLLAEGLIDGGLAAAGFLLFKAEREPSSVDGTTLRFGTGSVRLAVADEGGRIDINRADPELLSGLYSRLGGKSLEPAAFGARIADWRDEDNDPGEGGAEGEDYAGAGIGYGPRNGPFRSADELRLLLGLSLRDFDRLAPFITVFSPSGMIDPVSASETVLLAVPGIVRAEVEKLIAARLAGEADREALAAMVESGAGFIATEPSGSYRVAMRADVKTGFRDAAEAVVVAAGEGGGDFGVVSWSALPPAAANKVD